MNTCTRFFNRFLLLILLGLVSFSAKSQLKADFTASPTAGCPPLVIVFSDNSTGNPSTYKWDLGNNTISYLQNPVATYFNPGSYNVKLIVTNASGVDSVVKSQFITVYSLPEPRFGVSDTTGCFPLTVSFKDSSTTGSGTISNWQWDFGDGNLSNLQNPQHTYTNVGNYTVILKIVNSNGCTKVITKPALIKTLTGVNAAFSYSSVQGCSTPAPVVFTNTSYGTGNLSYMWDFGDGGTSTTASPIHNYQSGGAYTVSLIVKNSFGCADTMKKSSAINIGFVKAKMSVPDTLCIGQQFTAINISTPSTFIGTSWSFGDGSVDSINNAQKVYYTPGTYKVKLVTDFGSCADSVTKNVVVLPKPVPSFIVTNATACNGPLTVTFSNTSTGVGSYYWDFGDSTTSTFANPVHTYNNMGIYTVSLTVTTASGCSETFIKTGAVVIAPPRIARIDSLPAKGCIPFVVTPMVVMADSIVPTAYHWNFGDGTTSNLAMPSHTYTTPGSYDVTVIVVTSPGCTDTLKIVDAVRAGNKPTVNFSATPRDACASTTILFTDLSTINPGLVNEWYWTFGDGGTSVEQFPHYTYSDTGHFNVTLVASNFGCSDTLKIDNYMHIIPPIALFDTAFLCNDPLKRVFIDKSIGAQTWFWDFGDNTTSTQQNPTHVYAAAGNYNVALKVTNGACEFTKSTPVLVINEQPTVTVTDTTNCRNSRVTFRIANFQYKNIQNYIWLPLGLGNDSTVTTVSAFAYYYQTTGVNTMAVVFTDLLSCRDTLFAPAPIRTYGPSAKFASSIRSACYGATINFYDSSKSDGTHPIVDWTWNYGDSVVQSFPNNGPFSHFYNNQGAYTVSLMVTDSYGCKDSVKRTGLVSISKPIAKFIPSDTMLCPASTITFTNQSQGTNATFLWQFGDGTTSTTTSPTHSYALPGTYQVKLSVFDKNGCSDSSIVVINVFSAKALFSLSDSFSTCPPLIVNITNQSANYVQFHWDFGDGGNSQLVNPSHIYTYPGNYTVKLVVENNGGCVDSMTKSVVIQGPRGVFSYVPTTICNPGQINYSLQSNNTVKYIWDYDDGTTIFTTTPSSSHTYTVAGIYLPKIIMENIAGCRVPVVGVDSIKVIGVDANILADTRSFCDSGLVAFKDSVVSNDLPVTIMWDFGDGTSSSQNNPNHFYNHTGWYDIKLSAKSQFGCRDTIVEPKYVKVVPSPKVRLSGDSVGCAPSMMKFTGQLIVPDTSALTWTWNFGNGQTSTQALPDSQLYLSAGSYTITANVVNSDGCVDSKTFKTIVYPKPNVYAGGDTSICRFLPRQLQASGAASYVWAPSPSLSCTTCATPTAKPDFTTTYVVTGVSAQGCKNADSITLTVKQPIKITFAKGDSICVGKSVNLTASGADSYQWSPSLWLSNSSVSNPTATPDSSITYTVVGRDQDNCFKDSGKVDIKVFKYPTVSINGLDKQTVIVGSSLQLNTTASSDVTSYSWTPGKWLSCANCPNPVTKPGDNVTYAVNVKNRGGCAARDEITITLLCNDGNVFVPNTFSPNGDGANDKFFPRGKGINIVRNFTIFNRWGQVIFQRSQVTANDPEYGWDGKMNGVDMPTDVYVYLLEVICSNNLVFPIKGNVTLVR